MRFAIAFAAVATFLSTALPARAAEIFEWQSNNIQLLRGSGYELSDDRTQTTVTFEHADGWAYGDNFFYLDWTPDQPEETNFEFSPRLSLSKITGRDLSYGIVQDILLSGTWEKAYRFDAYLYGAAVDISLPGFNMVQVNLYRRDDPDTPGKGWQTTIVWDRPFKLGQYDFSFQGYVDYAKYEGGTVNVFTQPQLLMDVGPLAGIESGHAWAGIEWRYWHNKYGIDGVVENAPEAMVKWVF